MANTTLVTLYDRRLCPTERWNLSDMLKYSDRRETAVTPWITAVRIAPDVRGSNMLPWTRVT